MAKLIFSLSPILILMTIGVHTSMANPCGPGTTDYDEDPSTVCVACAAGRYSDAADAVGACAGVCPLGSFSGACMELRCGRTGFCAEEEYCAPLSELHEVSCCSDTEILGEDAGPWRWTRNPGDDGSENCQVWAGRDDQHGTGCQHGMNYADAYAFCDRMGARLCTAEELEADCTRGTGCNHDFDLIISGTVKNYATSAASCVDCEMGKIDHDDDSSTACVSCPAGKFSDTIGVGECEEGACASGTYGPPIGGISADQCEDCAPGQYDHYHCDLQEQFDPDLVPGTCPSGSTNCRVQVTMTPTVEQCMDAVAESVPWANGMVWEIADGTLGGTCFAIVGGTGAFQPATQYMSCLRYRDPGTPCANCPAGRFSTSTTSCDVCPVGRHAPAGSTSAADCEVCLAGWVDADADPATPCVPCPEGTFSNTTGRSLECDSCPRGSTSGMRSLALQECKPTVAVVWGECEPCASQLERNINTVGDTLGIFADSTMPFCVDQVVVKVHVVLYGNEMVWQFDGGESFEYTADHEGDVYFHFANMSLAQQQHTFTFIDTFGDGWHGGWWELQNVCGGRIGGGPVDGLVSGTGGSLSFSTSDMCCDCMDDPDEILKSMYTSCELFLGDLSGDCEADASILVDMAGTTAKQLCPVTCGACNAVALNTTLRSCGLCPVGFGLDEISNTYEDLDECERNNGGCDPLMGFLNEVGEWNIQPCTNTPGSFTCNACPEGFETIGSSCRLASMATANRSDIANVLLAPVSLVINGPAEALVDGSDAQLTYMWAVQTDIAAALQVNDPFSIVLDNVRMPETLRRQMQEGTIELEFDLLFNSDDAPELVVAMLQQLADSNSRLMTSDATSQLLADQKPAIKFVCPSGKVRLEGESLCRKCPSPMFASAERGVCLDCPLFQSPTERGDECTCQAGYYAANQFDVQCFESGFEESAADGDAICAVCPPCADCDTDATGVPLPKTGWHDPFDDQTSKIHLFACPEEDSCLGAAGNQWEAGQCAEHHAGYLCNSCSDGYGMSELSGCKPCEEAASGSRVAIVLSIFMVCVVILWTVGQKFWKGCNSQHLIRCAFQPARIVVSYCQIVGQLGDVLDFSYPPLFGSVIDAIRPFIEIWSLLFRALGSSDCLGFKGFAAMWNLRVWVLPLVLSGFVVMIYLYNRIRQPEKAAREFPGHMFLVIFFCYPTVCTVAFATYICRQLTDESSVLESDDTVLCEDASHRTLQALSAIVAVLFSLGIPVTLLFVLIKKAKEYSRKAADHTQDSALRLAKELDLDLTSTEAAVRDLSEGFGKFYFLTQAFLPQYLYWEACDMLRKLALVGLVLLAGRGSTAQIATALTLSFMFFAVHMKTWPYKIEADNMFRAATEIHIFIVICISMIFKTDLQSETLQGKFYDKLLLFSYVLLLPSSFVLTVVTKLRFVNKNLKLRGDDTTTSMKAARRRAYGLHQMGLASTEEVELLRRFVDGWLIRKDCAIFLSHFKTEAAAEARVLKTELQRALNLATSDVFLDADNLSDLRKLLDSVANSDAVFLLYTKGVLSRPWCIAELHAATQHDVPIIIVSIENAFKGVGGIDGIIEILDDFPNYLSNTNSTAELTLTELGLDTVSVASDIKAAIQSCEVLSFNPHLSSTIMDAQVLQMANMLVDRVCPENISLLPDERDKTVEPWPVTKHTALYIIHEEKAAAVAQAASEAKEWLLSNTDLNSSQIAVHSISKVKHDYDHIIHDVDCVLLLQSSNVLFEERTLSLTYAAVANNIPIVLANLVSESDKHQATAYNFETAQQVFSGDLSKRTEFALAGEEVRSMEATTGVSLQTIGAELGNLLPNIISKPLTIEKSSDLNAQMQEIERMLRAQCSDVAKVTRKWKSMAKKEDEKADLESLVPTAP